MQGGVLSVAFTASNVRICAETSQSVFSISGGLQSASEAYPDSYKVLWVQFTREITRTVGIFTQLSVVVVNFSEERIVKEVRNPVKLLIILDGNEHFLAVIIQNDL